jgi:PAS domain-containing protein
MTRSFGNHQSPAKIRLNVLLRALAKDPFVRFANGVFAVTILLRVLPILSAEQRILVTSRWSPFLFLLLILVSLRSGLSRLDREERRFWNEISVAYGFWFAVAVAYLFFPLAEKPYVVRVFSEVFFSLYYVALILAIERQPHQRNRWRSQILERALTWPSVIFFIGSFLVYFTVIPLYFGREEYDSYASSMCLYLAFDLVVVVKLVYSSLTAETQRWQAIYSFLATALVVTFFTDLAETLYTFAEVAPAWSTPWSFFWDTSYVFLVMAIRLRHAKLVPGEDHVTHDRLEGGLSGPSGQTMISALAFPFIHFSWYTLDWLGDPSKPARELLVGWSLLVLGTISFVQHLFLERRVRGLWNEHARSITALRSSEKDLRLMVERKYAQQLRGACEQEELLAAPTKERSWYQVSLFDEARDAVLVLDAEGCVRYWNVSASRLYDCGAAEALGKTLGELLDGQAAADVDAARDLAMARGSCSGEWALTRRDGRRLRVASRVVRLDVEGEPGSATLVLASPSGGAW